jgi:hypothetical protein
MAHGSIHQLENVIQIISFIVIFLDKESYKRVGTSHSEKQTTPTM